MSMELARQRAAQAWCQPTTEHLVMEPALAEAFAEILNDVWSKPWLGNATTRELLQEITTRIEMSQFGSGPVDVGKSPLDYRTVNSGKEQR